MKPGIQHYKNGTTIRWKNHRIEVVRQDDSITFQFYRLARPDDKAIIVKAMMDKRHVAGTLICKGKVLHHQMQLSTHAAAAVFTMLHSWLNLRDFATLEVLTGQTYLEPVRVGRLDDGDILPGEQPSDSIEVAPWPEKKKP